MVASSKPAKGPEVARFAMLITIKTNNNNPKNYQNFKRSPPSFPAKRGENVFERRLPRALSLRVCTESQTESGPRPARRAEPQAALLFLVEECRRGEERERRGG